MTSILEKIGPHIYTKPADLKVFGLIALNTRMTIVRLNNGDLWLHSPIAPNEMLFEEVSKLGSIKWLVSPNLLHHMFIEPWSHQFPEARVLGVKGLDKKQPNLTILDLHQESQKFSSEILTIAIEGIPVLKENVFYHVSSKTLIVTDIFFFNPDVTGFTKWYFWLNQVLKEPNTPLLVNASIKDKDAYIRSIQKIRQLDIERISMCHHHILTTNVQEHVKRLIPSKNFI
jgi:hypothetical protein